MAPVEAVARAFVLMPLFAIYHSPHLPDYITVWQVSNPAPTGLNRQPGGVSRA